MNSINTGMLQLLLLSLFTGISAQDQIPFKLEDSQSAYLTIISLVPQNATKVGDSAAGPVSDDAGPPMAAPEGLTVALRPQGDRCGQWDDWQKVSCWWPSESLDSLPPSCSFVPTKQSWPSYLKKFVAMKAMEKYSIIQSEYLRRGSPPKCGFCSRSFECRTRNETQSPFCNTKEVRGIAESCDDSSACEITKENGGCRAPFFLEINHLQQYREMINGRKYVEFIDLFMGENENMGRRQKRESEPHEEPTGEPSEGQEGPMESGSMGPRNMGPGPRGPPPMGPGGPGPRPPMMGDGPMPMGPQSGPRRNEPMGPPGAGNRRPGGMGPMGPMGDGPRGPRPGPMRGPGFMGQGPMGPGPRGPMRPMDDGFMGPRGAAPRGPRPRMGEMPSDGMEFRPRGPQRRMREFRDFEEPMGYPTEDYYMRSAVNRPGPRRAPPQGPWRQGPMGPMRGPRGPVGGFGPMEDGPMGPGRPGLMGQGRPGAYPGGPGAYPGGPGAYSGGPGAYPGGPGAYPGKPGAYPGGSEAYPGGPGAGPMGQGMEPEVPDFTRPGAYPVGYMTPEGFVPITSDGPGRPIPMGPMRRNMRFGPRGPRPNRPEGPMMSPFMGQMGSGAMEANMDQAGEGPMRFRSQRPFGMGPMGQPIFNPEGANFNESMRNEERGFGRFAMRPPFIGNGPAMRMPRGPWGPRSGQGRRPFGMRRMEERREFMGELLHGTTCVSAGDKCLCCCGHFIPNVDTGKCENILEMLPGISKVMESLEKEETQKNEESAPVEESTAPSQMNQEQTTTQGPPRFNMEKPEKRKMRRLFGRKNRVTVDEGTAPEY